MNKELLQYFCFGEHTFIESITPDVINKITGQPFLKNQELKEMNRLYRNLLQFDKNTAIHCNEVAYISLWFAQQLLPESDWAEVFLGGLMHDIGKLTFTQNLMNGSEHLSTYEKELISLHPISGHSLLSPYVQTSTILNMISFHHENIDGSGYPYQKSSLELPIQARITRIADVLSAMTMQRNYRSGEKKSILDAFSFIIENPTYFDRHLAFLLLKVSPWSHSFNESLHDVV